MATPLQPIDGSSSNPRYPSPPSPRVDDVTKIANSRISAGESASSRPLTTVEMLKDQELKRLSSGRRLSSSSLFELLQGILASLVCWTLYFHCKSIGKI